jgi:hypothetical protein
VFATQNREDNVKENKLGGVLEGDTMVLPEQDNKNSIENFGDRDASLKRALVRLQIENQRLKNLVVTLSKTILDNVVSNAANKEKGDQNHGP